MFKKFLILVLSIYLSLYNIIWVIYATDYYVKYSEINNQVDPFWQRTDLSPDVPNTNQVKYKDVYNAIFDYILWVVYIYIFISWPFNISYIKWKLLIGILWLLNNSIKYYRY